MSFVERCRQRHVGSEGGDEGFTLIELLVVLLIIGILLAIAIPTFLSVTKGANNTAAQSNLQNALTGAKTYFTDSNQTYTGLATPSATTSDIQQIGTGLSYISGAASTGNKVISFKIVNAGAELVLAAWAPGSNECWGIIDTTTSTGAVAEDGVAASVNVGTYYFVVKGATATQATCVAGTIASTGSSTTGFAGL
ncbi:MAG: prepilin-type N-terminal cleavage/methylation domain-containing protein [Acidimicrobiales bacterium]